MRIIHTMVGRCNPEGANGVDQTVFHLTQRQAAQGHTVALFSFSHKEPLPLPHVETHTYGSMSGTPLDRVMAFVLPEAMQADILAWQPDIVHVHSVYSPRLAVLTRWLRGKDIPYATTPHGGLLPTAQRRNWAVKMPYKQLFELPSLNKAAFIHALASSDATFARDYGVAAPIVTIPNGIDVTALPTDIDAQRFVAQYPQLSGKRILMTLGRLDPHIKGLDLLLDALALTDLPDVMLVMVGPDHRGGQAELEAKVAELNLNDRVLFTGPIMGDARFDALAAADAFVHPSRSEGLPFAILEAAAMGKPCVVTPVANPSGLITQYEAGLMVDPNPQSIAEGLRYVASCSPDALAEMGQHARDMIIKEFSWEEIAASLVEAYQTYAA